MKTNKNEVISTIVYERNEIPIYLQFKKRVIKLLVFIFPITTAILLFILIAILANFQYLRSYMQQSEPKIISELRQKNSDLNEQILDITNAQKELESRISSTDLAEGELFTIFKKPPGQKDLTTKPIFVIESLLIENKENNIINVSFNLKNLVEEARQSGHIFVLMQERGAIQIYPKDNLPIAGEKIAFSSGEAFMTSRFRPVSANFTVLDPPNNPIFTVLLFNRQGDVIHKEILKK